MHFFIGIFEDGKDGKDGKDVKDVKDVKDGKTTNVERQNGPVVVKASKDKKKINQKVSQYVFFAMKCLFKV